MGLFDKIRNIKNGINQDGGAEPVYQPQQQPSSFVPEQLFGNRIRATEVAPEVDEDDYENLEGEAKSSSDLKELASKIGEMIGIRREKDDSDENANFKGLYSEKYLRNIAKLRLSQLKIKYNLKVNVVKMAFGKLLEAVDKHGEAKSVWDTEVTLSDMDDVIEEIIFLDLHHQSKMGTLKPISPEEFFSGLMTVSIEKFGGEGFENFMALGSGAFDKVKTFTNNRKKPSPNG